MDPSHIGGKRFSVIGGARSGVAVARLLAELGGNVFLSEKASAEKMPETVAELSRLHIPAEFGGHSARAGDADVIVLSPGVPSDLPLVREATAQGRRVVSEIEVASWCCRAPIVAITGTNGKTTTTTLLGRIFDDARRPNVVSGNIGIAFSGVVRDLTEESTAILEISSFQLDHIESFRPKVSVLLNITPDHLDRYNHSFDDYVASKRRIFENQRAGDVVVYNADDDITVLQVERFAHQDVARLPFSVRRPLAEGAYVTKERRLVTRFRGEEVEVIPTEEISIRGEHNLYNAMAAALAARAMKVSTASLRATLKNFKGVEHRLEFVREVKGVVYVNDSKATNVDSVWYALQSFRQPIVVLLGGRDKGNDYTRLHEVVRRHVKGIVAIGESAEKVKAAFATLVAVKTATGMQEAVRVAASLSSPGDVVLLSPACASFDWFDNYEHRGRIFKECVAAL